MRGSTDSVIIMSLIMAAFVGFCVGMLFQEWREKARVKRFRAEWLKRISEPGDVPTEHARSVPVSPVTLIAPGGTVKVDGKVLPICNPPYGENLN